MTNHYVTHSSTTNAAQCSRRFCACYICHPKVSSWIILTPHSQGAIVLGSFGHRPMQDLIQMYDALLHPILLAASHGGKRNSGHLLWDWPKSLGNPFFWQFPTFHPIAPHHGPPLASRMLRRRSFSVTMAKLCAQLSTSFFNSCGGWQPCVPCGARGPRKNGHQLGVTYSMTTQFMAI